MIKTTYNTKLFLYIKVVQASKGNNITQSYIINELFKQFYNNFYVKELKNTRIKYQKRGENIVYQLLHATLDYDLYEKSQDLKKILKMSISYILAVAIEKYLDIVIGKITNNVSDNYYHNYILILKNPKKNLSYTVFWDYPDESEIIRQLE